MEALDEVVTKPILHKLRRKYEWETGGLRLGGRRRGWDAVLDVADESVSAWKEAGEIYSICSLIFII